MMCYYLKVHFQGQRVKVWNLLDKYYYFLTLLVISVIDRNRRLQGHMNNTFMNSAEINTSYRSESPTLRYTNGDNWHGALR